jgi:hypothetical protein
LGKCSARRDHALITSSHDFGENSSLYHRLWRQRCTLVYLMIALLAVAVVVFPSSVGTPANAGEEETTWWPRKMVVALLFMVVALLSGIQRCSTASWPPL